MVKVEKMKEKSRHFAQKLPKGTKGKKATTTCILLKKMLKLQKTAKSYTKNTR
jgi:hypothetical protein